MSPIDAWQAARPGRFPRVSGDEPYKNYKADLDT